MNISSIWKCDKFVMNVNEKSSNLILLIVIQSVKFLKNFNIFCVEMKHVLRRNYMTLYQRERRSKETTEERILRRKCDVVRKRLKIQKESVEEKVKRKDKRAVYMREYRKKKFNKLNFEFESFDVSKYVFLIKVHCYFEFKFGTKWYMDQLYHLWKFKRIGSVFVIDFIVDVVVESFIEDFKREVIQKRFNCIEFYSWNEERNSDFHHKNVCPICSKMLQVKSYYLYHLAGHFSQDIMSIWDLTKILSPMLKCVSCAQHKKLCVCFTSHKCKHEVLNL